MSNKENPPDSNPRIQLFNAKVIAAHLKEVAFDLIQSENGDVECRWFHGSNDCDLYYWRDEKKNIIKQQVSFLGQIIEWNIIEGLRTGVVVESDKENRMSGSPLVQFDSTPQMHTLEQGIEIVGHVVSLNLNDKLQLLDNFIKSPLFKEMTPEDIMKRYGVHVEKRAYDSLFNQFLNFIGLSKKNK